jgi:hypothetical protein
MKRSIKVLVAVLAVGATLTGVAVAASSPTVTTKAATKITNSTATLQGAVNPNGNQTGWLFQWGVTTAYGNNTPSHSAGHGTTPLDVSSVIRGLRPGTVYHYRLFALNGAGSATGADHTFKTTGPPPANVVTGPAVNVGKTTATVTGSVDTNGAATTWEVQYGLSTAYGLQTASRVIPNTVGPVQVYVPLAGLAPGTLFHYRLVGFHGGKVVTTGNDGVFFTQPQQRAKVRFSTRTRPGRDASKPYVFTTGATLHGAGWIPAFVRCTGQAGLRYYRGKHQVKFLLVPVAPNCKVSAQATFSHVGGRGPTKLSIKITFRGNGYIARVARTDHVTVR